MRMCSFTVVVVLFTSPTAGSDLTALCDGTRVPEVGQWAKYQIDVPMLNQAMETRYAIVGSESVNGEERFWFEFNAATPGSSMTLKFLVSGFPYDSVQAIVGKMGDQLPAMTYPVGAGKSLRSNDNVSEPLRAACDEMGEGVEESVTVPAGTFRALRVSPKRLGKDVWISPDVPFGLIKTADEQGIGMQLIDHGDDAVSAITETPQTIPGMGQ